MRRTSSRKAGTGVSLFPFLAVLLCTMGALIVMLMLVINQARAHAQVESQRDSSADEQLAAEQKQLKIELEDHTWRAEVLEQQREQIREQMAAQRLQLAHLEDHIRELEQRRQLLLSQMQQLADLGSGERSDAGRLEDEVARLQQALEAVNQDLDAARREAATRQKSYAILPYRGPNGTSRRPIYIECTEKGVVLQPENIVLRPDDFELLHSDNPLSAALRAIREYLARVYPNDPSEPYPLLIVRPNGVIAYAVAREAMNGWDDEFGYELVAADTLLTYPRPDPALATTIEEAIQASRDRQAKLRRAMPRGARASGFVVNDYRGGFTSLGPDEGHRSGNGAGSGTGGTFGSGSNNARDSGSSSTASQNAGTQNSTAGNSGGTPGNAPPGTQPAGGGNSLGMSSMQSLAQGRGSDWALKKKTAGNTGYRRPVRVVCQRDALILVPDPTRPEAPQVFRFENDPTMTVDGLVQALHVRMEQWGLPPLGGYWRPQLVVEVAPDAGERMLLLTQLLEGSGLEITKETR